MKEYIIHDDWKIIEEGFHPEYNRVSESLFSLGNGRMGQRGNFEETYTGDTLQGSYLAGIYYPDKTRVGWWKNGYPEYFAKIPNSANWIGLSVWLDGKELDIAKCNVISFRRELDMKEGILRRRMYLTTAQGHQIEVVSERFISLARKEIGLVNYKIRSLNFSGQLKVSSYLNGNVRNEDSNYGESFWDPVRQEVSDKGGLLVSKTKKTNFEVCYTFNSHAYLENAEVNPIGFRANEGKIAQEYEVHLEHNNCFEITKYVGIQSVLYQSLDDLQLRTLDKLRKAEAKGYKKLKKEQIEFWHKKWAESDITIEGDPAAQQAIRFNIFHLYQTYTGDDARLNIGPKGFTGEKYGGVTYWDTEAYCLPFFLRTSKGEVARNLLKYRHNHLAKAIENAASLGFSRGAALYPMVTINGEECHNEWEITFEEIHRNGAMAMAIRNYLDYTNDVDYIAEFGLEVLIGISRFWAQRVNWSEDKQKYVMLGVTGPNEYENNVNNNWYTNYLAVQTLQFTLDMCRLIQEMNTDRFNDIICSTSLDIENELPCWQDIINQIYLPFDDQRQIFLQQDGFLDKDLVRTDLLPADQRPIHEHWSWDRILRSCYIKQADVLQGLYFFEQDFDKALIKRHFDFYEPLTVHESSLSACIHSILASRIGYHKKAYEMYLHTARLDLDDYNNDTRDGLHITSMGGTWMSIVEGFGGLRSVKGNLHLDPVCPSQWSRYSFTIIFQDQPIRVTISQSQTLIKNLGDQSIIIYLHDEGIELAPNNDHIAVHSTAEGTLN